MNKKYGITGLILIVILATVMIIGYIVIDNTTNDKFTNAVTFEGITFYLPDGFKSVEKSNEPSVVYQLYSDTDGHDHSHDDHNNHSHDEGQDNVIGLFYYPLVSKSKVLSNMKLDSEYTNISESASYGGYSGYSAEFKSSHGEKTEIFLFEKDGKTLIITLSSGFNLSEYIPKIIG